jgi:hypothetical protein
MTSKKQLTTSHRKWLISELRADPELAAEYLNAAAEDKDHGVYFSALRSVAKATGMDPSSWLFNAHEPRGRKAKTYSSVS